MLLSAHVTSVLFLVQFNTFVPTPNYRLLLESHALTQLTRSYALMIYRRYAPHI